jgi:sugar lactone lactonase YvrE
VYRNGTIPGEPIGIINFAADGIALSADGSTLYFSTTTGRELYSVPTARLRDNGPYSELLANGAVQYLGQKGLSDGLEADSNGSTYCGNMEDKSIIIFQDTTGTVELFVRDPMSIVFVLHGESSGGEDRGITRVWIRVKLFVSGEITG